MLTNLSMVAVGIDLGTTYSAVAVKRHGKVEVIANDQGDRTTPSYVAFTNDEKLVGIAAKSQISLNPENTIFDAKRLIGRKYTDRTVQADMEHWPFRVKNNDSGRCVIVATHDGREQEFLPEQISAMVLAYLKRAAEAYLGEEVKEAVITVPAYFNDAQRQATKDAGTIAGLSVLRVINEPTAAALAFEDHAGKKFKDEHNLLIFDLGGGTFDVSVLTVEGQFFEVRSTSGDTHLGGEDFDNRLVQYLAEEFKRKTKKDISGNQRALTRLRTACERAKRTLSNQMKADIELDALCDGVDFYTSVSRAKFEELCNDLFLTCLKPVEQALNDAKMDKSQIHEVVLVGGSTKIPKVQSILQNFFAGKELSKGVNPDEAVAYGAAIQAYNLSTSTAKNSDEDRILLVDVASLSLGIETAGGIVKPMIKRNTTLPANQKKTFTTYADDQTGVTIKIYEGERPTAEHNNLLGKFELAGIKPAPRGEPQIEVTFSVDADGILTVTAEDLGSGNKQNITVTNDKNRLSAAEVERLVAEAEKFREEDDRILKARQAKNVLESQIYNMRSHENMKELSEDVRDKCLSILSEAEGWLQSHPSENADSYEAYAANMAARLTDITRAKQASSESTKAEEVD